MKDVPYMEINPRNDKGRTYPSKVNGEVPENNMSEQIRKVRDKEIIQETLKQALNEPEYQCKIQ